jgi:hypothetical protein
MKKFILKLLLLFGPIFGTIVILIILPLPENSYTLAIIDKRAILETTESPKIVLAGGSNLAFGIDSAAIEETFHTPVVNIGFYAGIGLGRILDDISPFLHAGDILVVIPEYEHFTTIWDGSQAAYELIFNTGFVENHRQRLFLSGSYGLPRAFNTYLSTRLRAFIARFRPPNPDAYLRDGFNEYGDYIKHLQSENKPVTTAANVGTLNASYINTFFRFVDAFTARGITVMLSWPSYEAESFSNSEKTIRELDARFTAKENLLVISRPEDYCFPKDLFYDTSYHLNAEGRSHRTARLLRDLRTMCAF